MVSHAQNIACQLLSQLNSIGREECESVELVLRLMLTFNINTEMSVVTLDDLELSQSLLPQLTKLAAHFDPVYGTEKPLHMININHMLTTIVKSLVSHWSSHERSELHATMYAARQFLHSDLENIKDVVSKWARSNPNGASRDSKYHIGSWEYSCRPISRPTARVIVPPRSSLSLHTAPRQSQLGSPLRPLPVRRSTAPAEFPATEKLLHADQGVKLSQIIEALELDLELEEDLEFPRSSISGDSNFTSPEFDQTSFCLSPDSDWDAHFDYFGLKSSEPAWASSDED